MTNWWEGGKPAADPFDGTEEFPVVQGGAGKFGTLDQVKEYTGGGLTTLTLTYNGSDPFDAACVVPFGYDPSVGGRVSGMFPSAPFLGGDVGGLQVLDALIDASGVVQSLTIMSSFFGGAGGMSIFDAEGGQNIDYLTSDSSNVLMGLVPGPGLWLNTIASTQVPAVGILSPEIGMTAPSGPFRQSAPILPTALTAQGLVSSVLSGPLTKFEAGDDLAEVFVDAAYFVADSTIGTTVDLWMSNPDATETIHVRATTSLTTGELFLPSASDWSVVDQNGTDLTVEDVDGRGHIRSAAGGVYQPTLKVTFALNHLGGAGANPAHTGTAPAELTLYDTPLVISEGVNDEFVFTGDGGAGTPETFTIPPGSYATSIEMAAGIALAVGTTTPHFGDICRLATSADQPHLAICDIAPIMRVPGAAQNGNILSPGANDALETIQFVGPGVPTAVFGDGTG